MKPPIIIGCAPSSGSTLLRTILGRHPSIASGGEVALLDKRALLFEPPERYRALIASWLDRGYPVNFFGPSEELFEELADYPWLREDLREMCLSMPSYRAMVDEFYARTVESQGASRWLDKCPSNVYCFDLIEELYSGARFIHMVRDARDAVVSYCRRGASPFRSVGRWYYATLSGVAFTGRPNYLRIRYEDLVSDPRAVIRRICEFLGEPYLDRLLQAERAPADPRHVSWRHSERAPVTGSVRRSRQDLTDRQRSLLSQMTISETAAQSLRQLGMDAIPAPIELQRALGYGTEGMTGAPLTSSDLEICWLEFEGHRRRMLSRYQADIDCPVRLPGAITAAA